MDAHHLLSLRIDCLLCRSSAALHRIAVHPHAAPFSAPACSEQFPDYARRITQPMDLRTIAEKLYRGLYHFGPKGEAVEAAERFRLDVQLVWRNCREYTRTSNSILIA